jgi:hypothetical protein
MRALAIFLALAAADDTARAGETNAFISTAIKAATSCCRPSSARTATL